MTFLCPSEPSPWLRFVFEVWRVQGERGRRAHCVLYWSLFQKRSGSTPSQLVCHSVGVVGYCWNRKHLILTAPDVQHKRNGIFHTHLLLVSKLQGVQQLEEYEKSVQLIWNQRKETWSRVVQTGRDEHETVISHVISYRRIGLHAIQQ